MDLTKDGAKVAGSGTGADVKRAYVGMNHLFDDVWSANITSDVNTSSTTGSSLFIK